MKKIPKPSYKLFLLSLILLFLSNMRECRGVCHFPRDLKNIFLLLPFLVFAYSICHIVLFMFINNISHLPSFKHVKKYYSVRAIVSLTLFVVIFISARTNQISNGFLGGVIFITSLALPAYSVINARRGYIEEYNSASLVILILSSLSLFYYAMIFFALFIFD